MSMSKYHYQRIAATIAESFPKGCRATKNEVESLVSGLVKLFKDDNSRFNEARFREWCGRNKT